MPAPAFRLPALDEAAVTLDDLLADGPAVLVFAESDCPTCRLALGRLGAAGVPVTAIYEDPPEVAARAARRAGVRGRVLSEPPPYATSRAYGVETVPTTVLVGADGERVREVVGWDRPALEALLVMAGRPASLDGAGPEHKPGCGARWTEGAGAAAAGLDDIEDLFERGWTDGLPVVPPTPERVEVMLGGRDPARSLGPVPPGLGEATLERVAACAVLAGCRPQWFGVVVAAVEAALDPAFNLHGQAVTTSPPGQIVVVSGPAAEGLGFHGGIGALGPGFRANLTVGRALRLVVTLTGQGAPGGLDRGTLGHGGKIASCFAERHDASPWEPLHVERGLPPDALAVTLVAGDAPLSVSDHRSRTPEALAGTLAWAAAATWSPNWWPVADATSLFVICPEHAALFAEAGWSKARLREALFTTPRRAAGELVGFGEATPAAHAAAPDTPFQKWERPEQLQIVVAGGDAGRFSAVFGPALGMGAAVVTRAVDGA